MLKKVERSLMKLNLKLIDELAQKYPEKFSRQQRALWKHGENLPSMATLLWLKEHEGIEDMNVFFVKPDAMQRHDGTSKEKANAGV